MNKNIKKEKNTISNKSLKTSLLIVLISFTLLMCRLGWLQFVNGADLKEAAYKLQTVNRIISPKRGTIYDSTGKALAISSKVDTVTIEPTKIFVKNDDNDKSKTKALKEKVARAFSDIFSLEYEDVFTKVNSKSKLETIVKKVEQDKIIRLKEWMEQNKIYSGINIDEDTKRSYPYNNLASNLIGFCGDDNQGLDGLESYWDSILKGTPGKVITTTNAVLEDIPDENMKNIPAEDGSNIILSIDFNIQTIAEKYLKQAVEENKCDSGNVIIMKPSNGDILCMATYPDYNLNTPFDPNTESLKKSWDKLSSQDKTNSLYKMWRNKSISDTYEPGSTFKLITTAIGLEEDLVDTDIANDFTCIGYEMFGDEKINCWKNTTTHGTQTLRESLENSCNPAFMQLGKRIGKEIMYKYFDAFGFFSRTGIQTVGENSTGIFHNIQDVRDIELATISFGQRFKITPLQLITAVSAIANDGILMQPRIVKEVVNNDTGVTTVTEPVQVRQVISKETSEKVKDLMKSVVLNGTGKYGAVNGYSIGGKTGTSEPDPTKPEEGYVASYIAISPIENSEIVILVTLYNPKGSSNQGGSVAGPVVSQILSEVLPYLQIPSDSSNNNGSENIEYITVPDITNKTVAESKKILENAGLKCKVSVNGDHNTLLVTDQVPKKGVSIPSNGGIVLLYTEENDVRVSVQVPDLRKMSVAQAINALKSKNLNISIEGTGKIISQTPSFETSVEEGTVIHVILKHESEDLH